MGLWKSLEVSQRQHRASISAQEQTSELGLVSSIVQPHHHLRALYGAASCRICDEATTRSACKHDTPVCVRTQSVIEGLVGMLVGLRQVHRDAFDTARELEWRLVVRGDRAQAITADVHSRQGQK